MGRGVFVQLERLSLASPQGSRVRTTGSRVESHTAKRLRISTPKASLFTEATLGPLRTWSRSGRCRFQLLGGLGYLSCVNGCGDCDVQPGCRVAGPTSRHLPISKLSPLMATRWRCGATGTPTPCALCLAPCPMSWGDAQAEFSLREPGSTAH